MSYACPRCGGRVKRGRASADVGVLGKIVDAAFAGFVCPTCGPIERSEFAPEELSKMTFDRSLVIVAGLTVLTVVIALLAQLR